MKWRRLAMWGIFIAVELLIGLPLLLLSLQLDTGWPSWAWYVIFGMQFAFSAVLTGEKAGGLSWK